jgi:lipopolysaccharide biosynthesis glycosyltransferase
LGSLHEFVIDMIDLLLVSNDKFCPHLATLLMSVAASTPGPVRANIVTNDASADSRLQVARAVPSMELRWLRCGSLHGLPPSLCGVDPISYGRLFGPGQLEGEVERLIYLDVDTLVRHDLTALWTTDLEGRPVAAVRDPWVTSVGHPTLGISNYEALGFAATAPYFNCGVIVIDVKRWNDDGAANRCLEFLSTQRVNRFADQDALNAVFCRNWTPLPMQWNVFAHPPHRPLIGLRKSTREVVAAQIDPAIVHYAGIEKPWDAHHNSTLLFLDEWQSFANSGSFSALPKRSRKRLCQEVRNRLTGATQALRGR